MIISDDELVRAKAHMLISLKLDRCMSYGWITNCQVNLQHSTPNSQWG